MSADSIIHVAGWTQHSRPPQRAFSHLRSLSTTATTAISRPPQRPLRTASKSISSSALQTMTTTANALGITSPTLQTSSYFDDDGNMSTIPDPRSRAMSPVNDSGLPSPSHHPDLTDEVATLSNKLINAINYQTNLDDTLSATRHDLEAAKERVRQLERESVEHANLISSGVLIQKAVADAEKAKLTAAITEERRQRSEIEKEKKNIEQELENLTTALFEEANKMVITAREEAQKEHDIVQRRNDQLKAQILDMEGLLRSQQEQLAELKQVMEHMTEERDDQTNATAPSTPGLSKFDSKDDSPHVADPIHSSTIPDPISPNYPTSFTHLLQTVLRTDLSAYDDFTSLLRMSKNVPVGSRASSGSYGSIGLGLGLGGHASTIQQPSNGSTSSLSTSATLGSTPVTPTTPASTVSTVSNNGPNSLTPLKDTKFYKRALAEDIEPTLRLDTAPGLSWLARRTVLNAVCEGSLVVEPTPTSTKQYTFACALCGESRKDAAHVRSHRFRTSENENAQRYPLCTYCLGRVRSTCDFLGFLRVLKDGHWRADDENAEKSAWEESVRLRESMFWCRIGGGVIPAHNHHHNTDTTTRSPRPSEDERKEQETKLGEDLERTGEIHPKDITPVRPESEASPTPKRMHKRNDTNEGLWEAAQEDAAAPIVEVPVKEEEEVIVSCDACGEVHRLTGDDEAVKKFRTHGKSGIKCRACGSFNDLKSVETTTLAEAEVRGKRDSNQSTSSLQTGPPNEEGKDDVKRLSITIPGSSE